MEDDAAKTRAVVIISLVVMVVGRRLREDEQNRSTSTSTLLDQGQVTPHKVAGFVRQIFFAVFLALGVQLCALKRCIVSRHAQHSYTSAIRDCLALYS